MFKVDVKEGLSGFKKGLIVGLLAVTLCLTMGARQARAEEAILLEPVVSESEVEIRLVTKTDEFVKVLKTFDWTAGAYIYRLKAQTHNIGVGISKDVGQYVECIGENWVDADVGKLFPLDRSEGDGIEESGYGGLSFNMGRAIGNGIEWLGGKFGMSITMPKILKENMLRIGIVGIADLTNPFDKDGWDSGAKVDLIRIGW